MGDIEKDLTTLVYHNVVKCCRCIDMLLWLLNVKKNFPFFLLIIFIIQLI